MSLSDSDSDLDWNGQLFFSISKKRGDGPDISEQDRCEQIQDCLVRRADINSVDRNGNTVLHIAVKKGYNEIVKFLLRRRARTDICNRHGHTAVILAENLNEKEISRILEESCEQERDQQLDSSRSVIASRSIDNERPSTSQEPKMFDHQNYDSGPIAKRKLDPDEKCDKSDKKPRLAIIDHPQLYTDSIGTSLSADPKLEGNTNGIIKSRPFDGRKTYAASGLKRTLHGVVYQWKHLMLILHRARRMGYLFRLATEMDAAEKFDDVVLEYEDGPGNKVHRFVQVKHKQGDTDLKMINATHLLDRKDGEFSILKYFTSWRKINRNSDFNESRSKKFFLCTNIGLDVEGLKYKNIDVNELGESDEFLKVTVKTKLPPRFYKLLHSSPVLYDTLKFASDVHRLAREIAERVCGSKDIHLNTEMIKCYHAALALEVIDIKNKKFSRNFIEDNSLSVKAKKFREVFIVYAKNFFPRNTREYDVWEFLERSKLKLSTNFGSKFKLAEPELIHVGRFSDEFVKLVDKGWYDNVVNIDRQIYTKHANNQSVDKVVVDNIQKLAGHVLILENGKIKFRKGFLNDATQLPGTMEEFRDGLKTRLGSKFTELKNIEFEINDFKTSTEEELSSGTELPDDNIDDGEISNFLNEFILAVNQPNELELGEMIRREVGAYSQFNLLNVDFIGDSFQNAILDWLKRTGKHSTFLGNQDADAFFVAIARELSSLITVGLNLPYSSELKKYDIKFEREIRALGEFLSSAILTQRPILEIISSEQTLLSALRVHQTLERSEEYKKNDSMIFIHLGKLLLPDIMNQVFSAFQSVHSHNLLVIDCESSSVTQAAQSLWNRLCAIMKRNPGKRMILIIQGNIDSAVRFEMGYNVLLAKDSDVSIDNLKKCSLQKLFERRIIKFQGHYEVTSFGRLLGIHDFRNIESKKLSALRRIIDPGTLVQLIQGKEILIGSGVKRVCEVNGYYIPRTIVGHVVIKAAVLQDPKVPDLFAIGGIDREALEKLVATERTIQSFGDCSSPKMQLHKCYILEKRRETTEFKNICEQNSNHNIHWLQGDSGKLLWQQSFGNITNLISFKDMSRDYDINDKTGATYLTEDQLIGDREKRRVVILTDTAGMGKSTVLTHLAEKMKQNRPNLLVIRINLTLHTTMLDEEQGKRTFDSIDTNGAVDFLVDRLSDLDTNLEREVFKEIINMTGKAALLFDGFDEISPTYEYIVIDLVQALSRLRIERLFITTRPHTSDALEEKLGTFSHNLQPFSPKNQVQFLTTFWRRGIHPSDYNETTEKRLEKHASAVLKILVKSINHQMQEFTGIPLQTRMVAEIFSGEEKAMQKDLYPSEESINLIDLYRRFVDKKYEIFCKEKKSEDQTNIGQKKDGKVTQQIFFITHQKLALDALFDRKTVKVLLSCRPEIDKMCSLFQDKNEGEERTGIVTEVISGKPHFVHRTFAEYFATEFLIETLKDNSRNQPVRKFFVSELFVEPWYKTIRAFLNCFLARRDYAPDKESWKFNLREHRDKRDQTLYHIAAHEGNVEIVRFFLNRLGKNFEDQKLCDVMENHEQMQQRYNPTDREDWSEPKLLVKFGCVKGESSETETRMSPGKNLFNQDVNINLQDKSHKTMLSIAVCKCDLALVECLVEGGADVNTRTRIGSTPLHFALLKTENLDIVQFLVDKGADINCQTQNGLTPLHYALRHTKNVEIVKYLIEKGANVNSKTQTGLTPLHYVTRQSKNFDIVKYLVQKGADINFQTRTGLTPLHYALRESSNSDVVNYLLEKGARTDSQT